MSQNETAAEGDAFCIIYELGEQETTNEKTRCDAQR